MVSKLKVALILPSSIWYSPFVRIYTQILDAKNIDYSIISWTREGEDKAEGYQYQVKPHNGNGSASLREYWDYIRFVKRTIRRENFNKLIVFCPQTVCLLSSFLLLHYKGRFMIDYRDLSIEQRPGFKQLYAFMLKQSSLNVISSPGFKKFLPKMDYILSHNINEDLVRSILSKGLTETEFNTESGIDVLTIGGIRDYSSNIQVIDGLANKDNITLRFIGRGSAALDLERYAKSKQAQNIYFKGYYDKTDEPEIIKSSTFLNIFYPRLNSHDTALSNRFYNSMLFKKPMIVTKNTTQGDLAEKFGIGIAIENCEHLSEELASFVTKDFGEYAKRCNSLLELILKEQQCFHVALSEFLES